MEKLALRYEGKAKKVYTTDQSDYLWVAYKDDATALNGKKKGTIHDKGEINNQLSALFFAEIEKAGILTHYVRLLSDRDMLVRSLEMIPLEVVVRNVVTGSLGKRLAVPEGFVLSQPVVELYYKDDELGDPMVNETHIAAMGWASAEDTKEIQASGLKINKILQNILAKAGIELIDFKLEFGIADGKVYLGDEISPDTCRYWDIETREKLDKDRFRQDLGRLEEAYQEVFRRVKEVLTPAKNESSQNV
ncbi:MAG: phosphoribosylaminoimidazolesuccinocarboxamide synthase [Desulfosporosinus sp.]|nr:phosphoribosylaminoimidazolesuccinocarboxamide synthase [Desulfosporosinus sp.]